MSIGRFLGRNRTRQPPSEMAGPAPDKMLTAADHCDRCGARAYVRVVLPSGLELLFCAHHNRQYASALKKVAVEIRDETYRLARSTI